MNTKTTSYAWMVVALLWPVAMLNYLDRQMVSTIRASIRADIHSRSAIINYGFTVTNPISLGSPLLAVFCGLLGVHLHLLAVF